MRLVQSRRDTKLIDDLVQIVLNEQAGVYRKGWSATDPDAERKFLAWLDARTRMARRYNGITAFQLHLIAPCPQDANTCRRPDRTIQWGRDEYPHRKEEILHAFRSLATIPTAVGVDAILIDFGDAIQKYAGQHPSR